MVPGSGSFRFGPAGLHFNVLKTLRRFFKAYLHHKIRCRSDSDKQSRIRHLEKEIQTFGENIEKLKVGD
ncbi:hypothetical protein [Sorangium sp. So ce176]|uniref:hypothetical protein n=1 Tax=Sorangium sp. So ce176 TaxID=3133286 RepID=UPI003F5F9BEA